MNQDAAGCLYVSYYQYLSGIIAFILVSSIHWYPICRHFNDLSIQTHARRCHVCQNSFKRDVVCYIFALFHALSFVVSLLEVDNWLLSELLQVLSREMTPSVPEVEANKAHKANDASSWQWMDRMMTWLHEILDSFNYLFEIIDFHCFWRKRHRPTDGLTDRRTERPTDGQTRL